MVEPRIETISNKANKITIIFIISILSLNLITILTFCISLGTLQSTLFFNSGADRFMDFLNVLKYISTRDPYVYDLWNGLHEKIYPPLSYLLFYPFTGLYDFINNNPQSAIENQKVMAAFAIMTIVLLEIFGGLLFFLKDGRKSIRIFSGLALLTSGITLFTIERGNIIFLAVIGVGIFLIGYKSEKRWLKEISYISLAFAFALKVYPALFGVLLLYDRRYKDAVKTSIYGLILFFLPFIFFHGGFDNISQMIQNIQLNSVKYMDTSITYRWGFIPAAMLCNLSNSQIVIAHYLSGILLVITVLTAWGHWQQWKKIMLLASAVILFPVNCGYYCGVYLFVPIILFLNEKAHKKSDWMYLVLIVIVLNPFQFHINGVLMTVPLANLALIAIYCSLIIEGASKSINLIMHKHLRRYRL